MFENQLTFLIVKLLLLTQTHSKLMQLLFLKSSTTSVGKRVKGSLWPSAHGNGERHSVDSIVWQKDFVILEVPPSYQDTNPCFSQFCESRNMFSLPPTTQWKALTHPGVKTMLATVMAISFLGQPCFSKLESTIHKKRPQKWRVLKKGAQIQRLWLRGKRTRKKLCLSSMDPSLLFK